MSSNKCAILHHGWGRPYIQQIVRSITDSIPLDYPHILVTEENADIDPEWRAVFEEIIEVKFERKTLNRKSEIVKVLPDKYDTWLYLDADIRVLKPLDLGFRKARVHGLAIAVETQYALETVTTFRRVMERLDVPLQGQFQYNAGIFFFHLNDRMREVFGLWEKLCRENEDLIVNDQPFLTLAMELSEFTPYTLSPSFSYRGFGELISGDVYVWHSYQPVPKNLNDYERSWPPRRVYNGKLEQLRYYKSRVTRIQEKVTFYRQLLQAKGLRHCAKAAFRRFL